MPGAPPVFVDEKFHLPRRLFWTDHVRANGSSVWELITSSQSFERVEENDKAVAGGNFKDVNGTDRDVAFFAREPAKCRNNSIIGAY